MPGVKFATNPEDPDFEVTADDDLAIAVGVIRDFSSAVFGHALPHLFLAGAIKPAAAARFIGSILSAFSWGQQYWFREEAILDAYGATHMATLSQAQRRQTAAYSAELRL
jgi:hypothetical protein